MKMHRFAPHWGLAVLLLSGCGGGGSGSPSASTQTIRIGQATVTYTGTAKPFATSQVSESVTITGMAGAAYSNIGLVPNQSLDNSLILYESTGALATMTPSGIVSNITGTGNYPIYSTFTHDGHIVFVSYNTASGGYYAYKCSYDGSNQQQLMSQEVYPFDGFAWAPNNKKIAWVNLSGELYVSNPDGSSPVLISTGGTFPAFSPDSSTVAFESLVGGYEQIYLEAATGGTATLIPGQTSTDNDTLPCWLPDGQSLMYTVDSGTASQIALVTIGGATITDVAEPSGVTSDEEATIAPDGKTVAYMSGVYGGALNLATSLFNGNDYATYSNPGSIAEPQWSPYFSSQTFVGSSGSMFSSASGFLWAQNGDAFASMVTFTASVPKSATITSESPSGSAELVFDVHATGLTQLKYTNCYYGQIFGVSAGGGTDMLVSFSSTTGLVGTIAPFIATRTAMKPVPQGNRVLYQAKFTGVYDAKGNNLAPNGATQLLLDPKTGKAISVG